MNRQTANAETEGRGEGVRECAPRERLFGDPGKYHAETDLKGARG